MELDPLFVESADNGVVIGDEHDNLPGTNGASNSLGRYQHAENIHGQGLAEAIPRTQTNSDHDRIRSATRRRTTQRRVRRHRVDERLLINDVSQPVEPCMSQLAQRR